MYISLQANPANHGDTIQVWAGECPPDSFHISWNFGSIENPSYYYCSNTGSTQRAVTISATVTDINYNSITGGTASATLYINPAPVSETISPSSATIYNGQTQTFTCPSVSGALTYIWNTGAQPKSSNGRTCTVTGLNETASNISNISITCTAKDDYGSTLAQYSATLNVNTVPATSMSVSPTSISLSYSNQYGYMTGTPMTNISGAVVSQRGVNYSSTNTSICAVDSSSGQLNAEGNGVVNVWVGSNYYDVSNYCQVTVTGFTTYVLLTNLTANNTPLTIQQGGSIQLNYTKTPSNADEPITFSTNGNGCSVSSSGVLTVGSVLGDFRAFATGSESGIVATWYCTVTSATIPVTGVVVTSPVTVTQNVPTQLYANVTPSNATDQRLYWYTNSGTITQDGVLTVSVLGGCTVSVSSWNGVYTSDIFVTCVAPYVSVTGISLSPTSKDFTTIGQTQQLTPTVYPSNATNKSVSYYSTDSSIATVNSSGLITSVAIGNCSIYCTTSDGGYEAVCIVSVVVNLRPQDWEWSYSIYSGGNVKSTTISNGVIIAYIMNATEWYDSNTPNGIGNSFTARINAFRKYKNNGVANNYNFTAISSESNFTKDIYNEAVNAINPMVNNVLIQASTGNISALMLNDLRDKLKLIK